MKLSIRSRLTAWYAVLMAATLLSLGTYLILELRAGLTQEIDEEVVNGSAAILQLLVDDDDEDAADRADDLTEAVEDFQEVASAALPNREATAAQILTGDGRVLAGYGARSPAEPLLSQEVRSAAMAGPALTVTAPLGPDAQEYRVRATAFQDGGEPRLLLLAISLRRVENDVSRLLILFAVGGPAVLVGTTSAAYWLAERALRPLGQMAVDAADIRTDRLHERVAVPPTDDELSRLALTLNAMLDRIEEGVNQQRRLIADASHELRTPLAIMRTEIDVSLRGDQLPDPARDVLTSAREEIDRMARTVDNLLTLAAVDEGKLELLTVPMDLRIAIDEAASSLRPLAVVKAVLLEAEGPHLQVQADAQRIHLALTNLIENAIRYSPAGGVVRVSSWRRPGEVGFTVADEGVGISPEDQDRLFDRFYRVDRARARSDGGSGLGLAISREVALAHGGTISVTSEVGKGSEFTLALPDWRVQPGSNDQAGVSESRGAQSA